MMRICVVGTGYVGLVTGTCLASLGHSVLGVDTQEAKIAMLKAGVMPIYEPGLEALVGEAREAGRLAFATDAGEAMEAETLVLVFAIGTPTGADGATADLTALLSAVETAARQRAAARRDGFVAIVVKSTVPVGTCRALDALVARHLPRAAYAVVSNPEFLREGNAIKDFLEPDRIVVGSDSEEGLGLMRRLYAPLTDRGFRLVALGRVETSEMVKYASNVFLAAKIGLVNEFARLCDRVGADIDDLAVGIGLDRRIGGASLKAGPGFGGSCFPKDLRALTRTALDRHCPMPIAEAVILSNEMQKAHAVATIVETLGGDVRELRLAVLGLSFKAGTDDLREAPALAIIEALIAAGARVVAYDPVAMVHARELPADIELAPSAEDAVQEADAVVIATEWKQFAALNWGRLQADMARPLVFDLRNILDGPALVELGYDYVALGRPGATTLTTPADAASLARPAHSIAAE
ncbi:UDP-glucose/GDP-mannose dehydrogenase family protein [Aurantimonas sp. Leaf443]|uniref:UDP-glucose dehydrogenase family protein n=1 Tax=Aurantimonas sp. Leaf443 TaxID=1736378 RepID=UPI0006F95065|nr:UDP-glucose/GDP-mannose dehydrogenase family protein [Aurantimonas sp. Leaf443]KQT88366.1 hypothetical protein ASG48_02790 [Aurantimonas sp. Leaf443]